MDLKQIKKGAQAIVPCRGFFHNRNLNMTQPFYQFDSSPEALRFEFVSVGPRIIRKVIVYQPLPFADTYNLVIWHWDICTKKGKTDY